jgi:hypothetical protein
MAASGRELILEPAAFGPECVKTLSQIEVGAFMPNLKFIGWLAGLDFA